MRSLTDVEAAKVWLKQYLIGVYMAKTNFQTIDEYIARFPAEIQEILQKIRMTIHQAAPEAKEVISYQMPAFHLKGNLVYFAAWKEHIGLYPPITGDAQLEQEVAVYAGPKGNLQFPLAQPMPYDLITRIVQHRVKQNLAKAAPKVKGNESKKYDD
jgi:uncharacterized protein YdhG (YjbR/CyaY superfamily)